MYVVSGVFVCVFYARAYIYVILYYLKSGVCIVITFWIVEFLFYIIYIKIFIFWHCICISFFLFLFIRSLIRWLVFFIEFHTFGILFVLHMLCSSAFFSLLIRFEKHIYFYVYECTHKQRERERQN